MGIQRPPSHRQLSKLLIGTGTSWTPGDCLELFGRLTLPVALTTPHPQSRSFKAGGGKLPNFLDSGSPSLKLLGQFMCIRMYVHALLQTRYTEHLINIFAIDAPSFNFK